MTDTAELIERLRELDAAIRADKPMRFVTDIFAAAASRLSALQAENESLRDALKPFDKALSWFESRMGDSIAEIDEQSHMIGCEIRVSDLRRARSALEASQ